MLSSLAHLHLRRRSGAALVVGCAATSVLALTVAGAAPAQAAGWPAKPASVHVSSVGSTYFTVSARTSANASTYTVYASTVKSDVFYNNILSGKKSSARRTASSSRPTVTVSHLKYTTAPWYYRFVASSGSKRSSQSGFGTVGLAPARPASLRAVAGSTGTHLSWSSVGATGFTVAQATNPSLTANRRNYSISDTSHAFTPYGLTKGVRYYFSIRGLTNGTPSHWTAPVSAIAATRTQSVRAMTYNILNLGADGTREKGGVIAPWSQRRAPAAALIKSYNPDVVGVQEGNWWADSKRHILQIDSLRSALGGTFTLAHTEPRYGESNWKWFRAGNYIMYKPSVYRAVGAGGYWTIGSGVYAVYQELQNIKSGARLLVVTTHAPQPGGRTYDQARKTATQNMISKGGAAASRLGVPVIYLGDFNSNQNTKQYAVDGPGSAMRSAHIADSRLVAQARSNPHWDSMNDYMRTPYRYDLYIDYVWATPGVSASRWGMAVHMSHNKFIGVIPSDHNPVYADLQYPY
jgi:endonuclease/exonuclease/phosphatase family metal-dependent hydrolase